MAGMQADPDPLPLHVLPVQGLVLKRPDTSVGSLAWSQWQSCRGRLRLGCFPGAMEVRGWELHGLDACRIYWSLLSGGKSTLSCR